MERPEKIGLDGSQPIRRVVWAFFNSMWLVSHDHRHKVNKMCKKSSINGSVGLNVQDRLI